MPDAHAALGDYVPQVREASMRQYVLVADDWVQEGTCPIHGYVAQPQGDGSWVCYMNDGIPHKFIEVPMGQKEEL